MPIHRFPKREDAGQRWTEACANSYLSSLEYLQLVERQYFVLMCGAVPTLNLPAGSDMSCLSDVNINSPAEGSIYGYVIL